MSPSSESETWCSLRGRDQRMLDLRKQRNEKKVYRWWKLTGAGSQSEGGMHKGWAEEEVRKSLRRSFFIFYFAMFKRSQSTLMDLSLHLDLHQNKWSLSWANTRPPFKFLRNLCDSFCVILLTNHPANKHMNKSTDMVGNITSMAGTKMGHSVNFHLKVASQSFWASQDGSNTEFFLFVCLFVCFLLKQSQTWSLTSPERNPARSHAWDVKDLSKRAHATSLRKLFITSSMILLGLSCVAVWATH